MASGRYGSASNVIYQNNISLHVVSPVQCKKSQGTAEEEKKQTGIIEWYNAGITNKTAWVI